MQAFIHTSKSDTNRAITYTLIERTPDALIRRQLTEKNTTTEGHIERTNPQPHGIDGMDEWLITEELRERYSRAVLDYLEDPRQREIKPAELPGGSPEMFAELVDRHLTDKPAIPIEERVRLGAAYMGRLYPGWEQRSNSRTLDMAHPRRNVLDQGGKKPFVPGVEPGCLHEEYLEEHGREAAIEEGFAPGPGETWAELTAAWAEHLERRQANEAS